MTFKEALDGMLDRTAPSETAQARALAEELATGDTREPIQNAIRNAIVEIRTGDSLGESAAALLYLIAVCCIATKIAGLPVPAQAVEMPAELPAPAESEPAK